MSSESSGGVTPTSEIQRDAWKSRVVAPPEEIRPNLWAVALPMMTGDMVSSFGYAYLGKDGIDLIDVGWDTEEVLEAWSAFLEPHDLTFADIRTITVTHHHGDHLGFAGRLRELSGAKVRMTRIETQALERQAAERKLPINAMEQQLSAWGVPTPVAEKLLDGFRGLPDVPTFVPDELLEAGDEITFGNLRLRVIITPGHTAGHACLVDEQAGLIFTGDHVLPGISPGIALGRVGDEDPLIDYVEALHQMVPYDACEVLPGHEYRFTGLAERARHIAAHHLRRTRALRELRDELGNATVWEYAERAPWSRGWHRLSGFLLLSALRQTEQHLFSLEAGRAQPWLDSDWPGDR